MSRRSRCGYALERQGAIPEGERDKSPTAHPLVDLSGRLNGLTSRCRPTSPVPLGLGWLLRAGATPSGSARLVLPKQLGHLAPPPRSIAS
jgi:hypothetical protein